MSLCLFSSVFTQAAFASDSGQIELIVRADDIGSSHAANIACIKSYREGIARTVEVMVPCPWFNEAVEMLNANPGYDVGIHLTLTSEWTNVKWRPLTNCPSLVDEQGNFFPMVWPNEDLGPNCSILEAKPNIEEVEQELRAQIELGLKKIKNVTHLSPHMAFDRAGEDFKAVLDKLSKEYKLPVEIEGAKWSGYSGGKTSKDKIDGFVKVLESLEPGLCLVIDHPGLDVPEMQAIGHKGYEEVAVDRQGVTDMFTSDRVMEVIERRKIKLLSYADALKRN
ncbi:MAG: polysaccharide deacetylase family protein [Planctomycetes bacterium]|nr:polysaccharide deacetylase family protein [Planctomycetota bacterium]